MLKSNFPFATKLLTLALVSTLPAVTFAGYTITVDNQPGEIQTENHPDSNGYWIGVQDAKGDHFVLIEGEYSDQLGPLSADIFGQALKNVGQAKGNIVHIEGHRSIFFDGNAFGVWASVDGVQATQRIDVERNVVSMKDVGVNGQLFGAKVEAEGEGSVQANRNSVLLEGATFTTLKASAVYVQSEGDVQANHNVLWVENLNDRSSSEGMNNPSLLGTYIEGKNIESSHNEISLHNVEIDEVQGVSIFSFGQDGSKAIANNNLIEITNDSKQGISKVEGVGASGEIVELANNQISVVGVGPSEDLSSSISGIIGRGKTSAQNNLVSIQDTWLSELKGFDISGLESIIEKNRLELHNDETSSIMAFNTVGNSLYIGHNQFFANEVKANLITGFKVDEGRKESLETSGQTIVEHNDIRLRKITMLSEEMEEIGGTLSLPMFVSTSDDALIQHNSIAIEQSHLGMVLGGTFISKGAEAKVSMDHNRIVVNESQIDSLRAWVISNGMGASKSTQLSHNTVMVKDSSVDELIGVTLVVTTPDKLSANNNRIILQNSHVERLAGYELLGATPTLSHYSLTPESPIDMEVIVQGSNHLGSMTGVSGITFNVATAKANEPMLKVGNEPLNLSGQTLTINTEGLSGQTEQLSLIDGSVMLENATLQTAGTFGQKTLQIENTGLLNGLSLDSPWVTELFNQKAIFNQSVETLTDARVAQVAMVRQSIEVTSELLDKSEVFSPFAMLSGAHQKYDWGSGIDLNDASVTFGVSGSIDSAMRLATFAQFGWGNADSTVEGGRSDSDLKRYTLGVALRYQTQRPFYLEGSLVGGVLSSDFNGTYVQDKAKFNNDTYFVGGHAGIGSPFKVTEEVNLTLYGQYRWQYLDGDRQALNNRYQNSFQMDDVWHHGLRVGVDVDGQLAKNCTWYSGLAYERVFGDINTQLDGQNLRDVSLQGNVGSIRAGVTLKPENQAPWALDMGIKAYTGEQQGLSASVSMQYSF